jgi:hypothetical protein
VLGIFDVAAGMGMKAHDADFGQTFGRYGVKPGPYLYVPVLGPSNFRDGVGRVLDFFTDPIGLVGQRLDEPLRRHASGHPDGRHPRAPTWPSARWIRRSIPT